MAGTLVLVSTDALWRQSQKPSQVVALQPDDRESDRGDVRPQQPRRGLSHHVRHVVVRGVWKHGHLLDEWLSPCRIPVDQPIPGLATLERRRADRSPISVAVPELVSGGD